MDGSIYIKINVSMYACILGNARENFNQFSAREKSEKMKVTLNEKFGKTTPQSFLHPFKQNVGVH